MAVSQIREFPDGFFGDCDVRILLRFNSSHIPGKPGRRHIELITTFFEQKVGRRYSDDHDYVHLPSAIFEHNVKCWMVIDLSVKRRKTLDNVPLFCYRVRTSNDGASVQFFRVNFTNARHYSNIFPWGRFLGSDTSDDSGEDEEKGGSATPESSDLDHPGGALEVAQPTNRTDVDKGLSTAPQSTDPDHPVGMQKVDTEPDAEKVLPVAPQPTDPNHPVEAPEVTSPTTGTDVEESLQPTQGVGHDESAKELESTAPADVDEPIAELEPTQAADEVTHTNQLEPSNTAHTNDPNAMSEKEQGNESKDNDSRKGTGSLETKEVHPVDPFISTWEVQQWVAVAPLSPIDRSQEQSNNQSADSKTSTPQAAKTQPQYPCEKPSQQPITPGKEASTAAYHSTPKKFKPGLWSRFWKGVSRLYHSI
ncbi:uncharacterized protein BDCG_02432 [Blastomyces dermatitidis ER-3]|uniref:Uncharacterized protein n=1 Tax=Ajellomyces dermatitidis (strain ER-3 / ATCC MYA-2586) TaxID=559297 RepID=A0ABM9YGY7_AJEDR|nr:uncharacterized protein BDCG_02432 [Blastomyces dermatitidis ER-3]EEQ87312.1 hypothetical protein BDCG_02432 [Blastomyces dermatitidis ER-3]